MIGPKKLSNVRQELRRAMATAGDDPIRWLEERMTSPEQSEVLQFLRRFLAAPGRPQRRAPRAGTKK